MKRLLRAGALLLLAAVLCTRPLPVHAEERAGIRHPGRVIARGISVEGVDMSGRTEADAAKLLDEKVRNMGSTLVILTDPEEEVQIPVTLASLGISVGDYTAIEKAGSFGKGGNAITRFKDKKDLVRNGGDIRANYAFDRNAIESVLIGNAQAFAREAQDAAFTRVGGEFSVTPAKSGRSLDAAASAEALQNYLTSEWDGGGTSFALVMHEEEPRADAEQLGQIKDLLGTFTTDYSSSGSNRCNNVANGTRLAANTLLYPGEQFSMLKHITPFTAENGYYLAGSYMGSQVVESFGGGICQVSTTLYNAVIRAELRIDERYNHSLIVNYVKPSCDAAIAESSGMDLKFTNTLDYPVYIEGYCEDKKVTFNIWGVETRPANREVAFESETLEVIDAPGEKIYADSTKPVGYTSVASAHTGYRAQMWKVVREDGKEVSREVFNKSYYNPAPTSMTVGTAGEVSADLRAAIAANSIAGVKSVLAGGTFGEPAAQELAEEAAQVASEVYEEAMAQGLGEQAAMEQAQSAASDYVAEQVAE